MSDPLAAVVFRTDDGEITLQTQVEFDGPSGARTCGVVLRRSVHIATGCNRQPVP